MKPNSGKTFPALASALGLLAAWLLASYAAPLPAKAPPAPRADYYASVDTSDAFNLRATLHELIDDHVRVNYSDNEPKKDVWDIVAAADADPDNPGNILDFYANESYPAVQSGTGALYDREHTWPSSYGFTHYTTCNYPYTDGHHLVAADSGHNRTRKNKPFRWCGEPDCEPEYTQAGTAVPGGGPGDPNLARGTFTDGAWQVWSGRRGDVARAQLYMDVRYEGGFHASGCEEPDLILTDNEALIVSDTTNNFSPAYMGYLTTLLEWHFEDPPDAIDMARNNAVQSFQGNRNPFTDHPEYVCILWADEVAEIESRRPGLTGALCEVQCPDDPIGPPTFPRDLLAMPGDGVVALDWDDNSEADLEGYNVYRSETSGGPWTLLNGAPVAISQYSDTTAVNGTTYFYVVRAVDCRLAESINSNQVSATPAGGVGGVGGLWINEFHYDNASSDTGEFVEIAGPAGADLSGWIVGGYNGLNGTLYDWVSLSGVIPDQQNCYGTLAFAFPAMQNGPDALALVDDMGFVVQFISYEGSFSATDSAAAGLTSADIGVQESGTTPVGHSLQLSGSGSSYADFAWQSPQANTMGQPNAGQTFTGGCPDTEPPAAPGTLTAFGGNMYVELQWPDSSEPDLQGYNIHRAESMSGPWTQINVSPVAMSEYVDFAVVNGTTYYYVVTAVDEVGNESGPSNIAQATPTAPSASGNIWINEIHYDNEGGDTGEFVEIAGLAGVDVSGWSVVGYNGSNGTGYMTVNLSGVIPDQDNCYGTLAFDFPGMQNGAPDGLALIDDSGAVAQFISYEGAMTATAGPASGVASQDIGVFENAAPAGQTLQLGGSGINYGDFIWEAPNAGTPGQPNANQAFAGGGCRPPGVPDIELEPAAELVVPGP